VSNENIIALKEALPPLVSCIPDLTPKTSNELQTPHCPMCGTGTDRGTYFIDSGSFYCRRCDKRLDIIAYHMAEDNKTIPELMLEYNIGVDPSKRVTSGSTSPRGENTGSSTASNSSTEKSGTVSSKGSTSENNCSNDVSKQEQNISNFEKEKRKKDIRTNGYAWKMADADNPLISSYYKNRDILFTKDFEKPNCIRFSKFPAKGDAQEAFSILYALSKEGSTSVTATARMFFDSETLEKINVVLKGKCKGLAAWFGKDVKKSSHICIGEGVETTLSYITHTDTPGAAGMTAAGLRNIEIPESVTEIDILTDSDAFKEGSKRNFEGQRAAYILATRFEAEREGNIAWLVSPHSDCFSSQATKKDFNDNTKEVNIICQQKKIRAPAVKEWIESLDEELPLNEDDTETNNPVLAMMLKRFVIMRDGNKIIDTEKPNQFALMKKAEFETCFRKYGHLPKKEGQKGPSPLYVSDFFMQPDVRAVVGERFWPKKPLIFEDHKVNWFNSFYAQEYEYTEKESLLDPVKEHFNFLFPENTDGEDQLERFIDWLSWTVIHPETRTKWTPLLIAKHQRTGRGWIVELINKLLGNWNCTVTDMGILSGKSNDGQYHNYMHNSLFCAMHEVRGEVKDAYEVDDAIRSKLTEDRLYLNLKYGKNGTFPIFTKFLMMSNHANALVLDESDKRIEVFEHFSRGKNEEYYDKLYNLLENEETMAQMYYFLDRWCTAREGIFKPKGHARDSGAKRRMTASGSSEFEDIFNDVIESIPSDVVTVKVVKRYVEDYLISSKGMDLSVAAAEQIMEKKNGHITMLVLKKFTMLLEGKKIKINKLPTRIYAVRNESEWTLAISKKIRKEFEKIPEIIREEKDTESEPFQ